MSEAVRYSDTLQLSVLPGFRQLIDDAARRNGMKPTEWARQRLTESLRAVGLDPAATPLQPRQTNPAAPQSEQTASEIT